MSGASPDECVEQIDIGGPSMVRAAAKNHPSVAIVTSPGEVLRGARGGRARRLHPRPSAGPWPPRRSCTPRRTTCTWRRGWATCSPTPPPAPASRPGWARPGPSPRCCATARTRTSGRALRQRLPARAGPRPGAAAARQGDVLQQLRRRGRRAAGGVRPRRPADRGDHQARQPLRHRRGRGHRRRAPQGARLRPGLGVRRHHRHQPSGHGRDGRDREGHLHRGGRGARRSTTTRWRS